MCSDLRQQALDDGEMPLPVPCPKANHPRHLPSARWATLRRIVKNGTLPPQPVERHQVFRNIARYLTEHRQVAGNDREAASQRLDQRNAKTLDERRKQQRLRMAEPVCKFGVGAT